MLACIDCTASLSTASVTPVSRGIPLDVCDSRGFHNVEAYHGVVVHDNAMVGLDEAHSTHIGSKIEDVITAFDDRLAVIVQSQIYKVELMAEHILLRHTTVRSIWRITFMS